MFCSKPLKTFALSLSALGFSIGAIAPVVALNTPNSTPSSGAPPRTASGAPQRTTVQCVVQYIDADNDEVWDDTNRDGVPDKLTPMTVLSPSSNITTSLDPSPTLFVYLPKTYADGAELVISEQVPLRQSPGQYRYREIYVNENAPVPTSAQQGPRIATYSLADVDLQPGKTYYWSLSLFCGDNFPGEGQIEGLITCDQGCVATATIPDPQTLTTTQLAQQATDYAADEFWNETIRFTAELRKSNKRRWDELLESQGLGCFKDVPFADEVGADYTVDDDPRCFVE